MVAEKEPVPVVRPCGLLWWRRKSPSLWSPCGLPVVSLWSLWSDTVDTFLPQMALGKQADRTGVPPGGELLCSPHYRSAGEATAHTVLVVDTVPMHTTYVSGSLRVGAADAAYVIATPLTDAADGVELALNEASINGSVVDRVVTVMLNPVAADDGNAGAGQGEGIVYFKVKVD